MAVDWVARGIGGAAVVVSACTAIFAARRQRRALRPVVICEEISGPQEVPDGGQLAAVVRLNNPSGAPAYNLRLGIELNGARVTWGEELINPPRLNELGAGEDTDAQRVLIPAGWAFEREADPWAERVYWVDYQDVTDWWWTTRNPWRGHQDVAVRLIGGKLRWWLHRRLESRRQRRALRTGRRAAERALEAARPKEPD